MKKIISLLLLLSLSYFLVYAQAETKGFEYSENTSEKYSLYKNNGKYGLIDSERNIVLDAEFDDIKHNEVYLCTSKDSESFIYSEDLEVLHKFKEGQHRIIMASPDIFYYEEGEFGSRKTYLFSLSENKIKQVHTGLIEEGNCPKEQWIAGRGHYFTSDIDKFTWKPEIGWERTYPYRNNRAVVYLTSDLGEIIDENFSPVLGDLQAAAHFYSEGLLPVVKKNGESCYVDLNGKVVHTCDFDFDPMDITNHIDLQLDLVIGSFVEGMAVVKAKNNKWIILDRDFNKKYLPQEYDIGEKYMHDEYGYHATKEIKRRQTYYYSNGLLLVWKVDGNKRLYGYLNKDCNLAIPCIFTDAEPFVEGYAIVKYEDKDAIIDVNGNIYFSEDLE